MTLLAGRYGRTLTKDQLCAVSRRLFVGGTSPMLVQLVASLVRHWTSTDVVDDCLDSLPTTVHAGMDCVLDCLEQWYGGAVLVGRTLGLMTLAELGLTDAELDDVLSLDDVVFDALPSNSKPSVRSITRVA